MGKCNRKGDVTSPTFRTVLRMLRVGTGIHTSNNIRRAEATKEIVCLAGGLVDTKLLSTRGSGISVLAIILTKYLGKPVSFGEASECFHNPKSQGMEKTEFFTELLAGRRWPPRAADLTYSDEFGYDRILESHSDWYPRGLRDVDQWIEYIASVPDTARLF